MDRKRSERPEREPEEEWLASQSCRIVLDGFQGCQGTARLDGVFDGLVLFTSFFMMPPP